MNKNYEASNETEGFKEIKGGRAIPRGQSSLFSVNNLSTRLLVFLFSQLSWKPSKGAGSKGSIDNELRLDNKKCIDMADSV